MAWVQYSADRVFDGEKFLAPGTVVAVDGNGVIQDLLPQSAGGEVQKLEGILTPGLINAHCHLELSHFKNLIEEGTGLVPFLMRVVAMRKKEWRPEEIQENIGAAAAEMQINGITGIGDICNTTDAIATKVASRLFFRNFIEVLNFSDANLSERMVHNSKVLEAHFQAGLAGATLSPHAPYSVSLATFAALNEATAGAIISIHNQESAAETELFRNGTGAFLELYGLTGTPPPQPTGKSSLQWWLPFFTKGQTIVLVHNTFTQKEDILFAKAHAEQYNLKLVWCLCPGANKYIENALPPLPLFLEQGCTLALGTDSYSSNQQLSIAAEIKWLTDAYPEVPLESLLQAATSGGSGALGWPQLGRLEKGMTPGLALLHTDPQGKLTGSSRKVA